MQSSALGWGRTASDRLSNSDKGDAMLFSLHLWAAPVRNLVWVTSAFGYR